VNDENEGTISLWVREDGSNRNDVANLRERETREFGIVDTNVGGGEKYTNLQLRGGKAIRGTGVIKGKEAKKCGDRA